MFPALCSLMRSEIVSGKCLTTIGTENPQLLKKKANLAMVPISVARKFCQDHVHISDYLSLNVGSKEKTIYRWTGARPCLYTFRFECIVVCEFKITKK